MVRDTPWCAAIFLAVARGPKRACKALVEIFMPVLCCAVLCGMVLCRVVLCCATLCCVLFGSLRI